MHMMMALLMYFLLCLRAHALWTYGHVRYLMGDVLLEVTVLPSVF